MAYERAIELDPTDVEAHSMLGQLLVEAGRPLDAVPNWRAVLKHVRDARHLDKELRRNLVRGAIECLLEAHAESNGQIDLLPTIDPAEIEPPKGDEPAVLELREFDLSSEEGINDFCDIFVERPRRAGRGLFRRPSKPTSIGVLQASPGSVAPGMASGTTGSIASRKARRRMTTSRRLQSNESPNPADESHMAGALASWPLNRTAVTWW